MVIGDPKWSIPEKKFRFPMKKILFTLLVLADEMKWNLISGMVVVKRPIKKYKQTIRGNFWIWLLERGWTISLFCQICQALSQLHPHYWFSFRIFQYPNSSIKQKTRKINKLPRLPTRHEVVVKTSSKRLNFGLKNVLDWSEMEVATTFF